LARQRPKNGAIRIIEKATAIATCICFLLFPCGLSAREGKAAV
jgi:hypothetical protein